MGCKVAWLSLAIWGHTHLHVLHNTVVLVVLAQLGDPRDLAEVGGTDGRLERLVCQILEPTTTEVADDSPSSLPLLGPFRPALVLVRNCAELHVCVVSCTVQIVFSKSYHYSSIFCFCTCYQTDTGRVKMYF
jgi:hypothetical protein